jgi:hypothetical protein
LIYRHEAGGSLYSSEFYDDLKFMIAQETVGQSWSDDDYLSISLLIFLSDIKTEYLSRILPVIIELKDLSLINNRIDDSRLFDRYR